MNQTLNSVTNWPERAAAAGWSIAALTSGLGVSMPTLQRFFKQTKGQSPQEWLHAERMRLACDLLERRKPIKDIAGLLLYGHPSNFVRAFTKHFGVPPGEYTKKSAMVDRSSSPD